MFHKKRSNKGPWKMKARKKEKRERSHMISVHTFAPYFSKFHFNVVLLLALTFYIYLPSHKRNPTVLKTERCTQQVRLAEWPGFLCRRYRFESCITDAKLNTSRKSLSHWSVMSGNNTIVFEVSDFLSHSGRMLR
jgi:hypothetical protein